MPIISDKQSVTIDISTSGSAFVTALGWIPMDIHSTPFNASFGVIKTGSGKVTFKVQHTFDDVQDPSVTPVAFTHADVSAAENSTFGKYDYPVRAIRLAVASASSSTVLGFRVIQAGV